MKKIILIAALFLTACNSHDINKVQKGMSKSQVTALMGKPTNEQPVMGSIVWLRYGDNQVVVLENDTVVNVVADAKATMKAEKDALDGK